MPPETTGLGRFLGRDRSPEGLVAVSGVSKWGMEISRQMCREG